MPVNLERRERILRRLDDVVAAYLIWKSALMTGNVKQDPKSRKREVFVYRRTEA